MRITPVLVACVLLAGPAYAQTASDSADHEAHHPAATETAPTSPAPPASAGQPSAPLDETPSAGTAAAGSSSSPAGQAMNCPMMPEMMQSMMKGMMQGMMGSGGSAMGAMGASGMGGAAMSGMPGGAGMRGSGATAPAPADQSLQGITLRAISDRTIRTLRSLPKSGDAEFARVAVALEEGLLDAARAAAAFAADPETRRKAQELVAAHEAELASLRALANSDQ